jgi:uncharacterized protein YndB with AHSA1/START domain
MANVIGDPTESPAERAGIVRASVDIAASPAEVFRALAEPRELAAWLGGGEPAPADPRDPSPHDAASGLPPGEWRVSVVAPDGTLGAVTVEYGYRAPPHFLDLTWRASWNDFATERVRFQLVPVDVGGVAGTRVTVTHTRAEARLHVTNATLSRIEGPTDAWPAWLARLATHVGTTSALARWSGRDDASAEAFGVLHRAVVDLHGAR